MKRFYVGMGLVLFAALASKGQSLIAAPAQTAEAGHGQQTKVPVVFSGGHETDGRDRGRPVILVASALGVPADVFREAFTHVHPAQAGSQPTEEQVRSNKRALMEALGKYGVTDERLNEVSNYYRYVRSRGELWPTGSAEGYAVMQDGKVCGFVVTNGGSGYSSTPTVSLPGVGDNFGTAQLSFTQSFDSNGSVSRIDIAPKK